MKLTREQIEKASDEELREWVAEYVMGMVEQYVEGQFGGAYVFVVGEPDGNWISKENIPHYSTDIAAAWQVVEKFKNHDPHGFDICCGDWGYTIQIGFYDETLCEDESAPRAICKAALLAVCG